MINWDKDYGEGRSRWRKLAALVFVLCLAFGAGFVWFVTTLSGNQTVLTERADGIVVLTGGSLRVSDGLDLLAAGHAQRLLISGVRPGNTPADILRNNPEHEKLLSCCVDLDPMALNTRGNAFETQRWAHAKNLHSLIVVTSNYHMPRAFAEFAHALPEVKLIPYSVIGESWHQDPWWMSDATLRLLFLEYSKYIFAKARIVLNDFGLLPESETGTFASGNRLRPVASR